LEPFTFNKLVGDPVDIPNSQLEKRAKRVGDCRRIGFGVKSHYPTEFQRLQELFVRVRSLSFCRKMWSTVGVSWDWNGKLLCTYNGYGKNSCFGDYGSPLMCFVNSRPIHVGVHLFATNPCVLGLNGVVRTLRYRTWIRAQLNAGWYVIYIKCLHNVDCSHYGLVNQLGKLTLHCIISICKR